MSAVNIRESEAASVLVRELEVEYPDRRTCFVCGKGDSNEALTGSSPLCDWVHLTCLQQPVTWD